MNQIRAIQALNKKEIENGISPEASWHRDYRDTAFVYFGGLPYELSEGDVITIFSQFGEPTFLKLVRDKETGKSKGFGWLKYEDQRSTDLAVDNLGGAEIQGRLVRVDHAVYKARDDEDQDEFKVGWEDIMRREGHNPDEEEPSSDEEEHRPALPEERELALLMRDHDDDDPMKAFLVEEKKKQVEEARERADKREKRRHHKPHRSHGDDHSKRPRRDGDDPERRHRRERERDANRPRDDSRERQRRRRRHDDEDRRSDRKDRHRHTRSHSPRQGHH